MPLHIMESRYIHLARALEGYTRTGVALIEYNGTELAPSLPADDIGIYCIIPKIAKVFSLPLDTSIHIFFVGITILASILGAAGFFSLYRSFFTRTISYLGITFLTLYCLQITDVYLAYAVTAIAIIPWALYFTQRNNNSVFFPLFTFLAVICIGFFHYIRANSGTAALIFLTLLIVTMPQPKLKKALLVGLIFLGIIFPVLYFKSVISKTQAYAHQHLEGRLGDPYHPFWHQMYIGLGFLSNDLGLSYDDSVGFRLVEKSAPNTPYPSAASEKILKNEVSRLRKEHFIFVVHTVGAKLGITLLYFLLFANFGIFAAFFYPQRWRIIFAFFCALAFSALFGIIAIPYRDYLLGFFACATLFGITSINHAVSQLKTTSPFFKKFL